MYKKLHKRGMRKPHIRQILLIMRLTTVLLLGFILQVSASGYAQKLTLRAKNEPLSKIFTEIRKQSGYDFVFTNSTLNDAKPVSITVKEADINEVLERIFKGQPLEYKVKDRSVVVSKKEIGFLDRVVARFQDIDIRAKVTDEKGLPLLGASVRVKNTNQVAMTDAQGIFTLNNVPDNAILVVSFIGYNQKEVKASANMEPIVLEVATSKLDEVQVMAYGTTSRRLSTSNIISVKAADIEKQPVTNPLLALQGRVPGLDINQSTGFANSGVTVRIQGQNSITKGSDPLYVIDGVPYPSQMLRGSNEVLGSSSAPVGKDGMGSGFGSPLSFINPASIESIDVLKDADATAIYGSRAAAGAILITTKKGKAGETRVDASIQSGTGRVSKMVKLLNTEQYLELRKEAFKNNGLAIPTSATIPAIFNYDLTVWDQNRYTDWQKELIGGSAIYTNADATASGGSTNTQFLIGAGYHKETTVFPADFGNSKASLNFSLNNTSINQKFRIQLTGSYMSDNNNVPSHNLALDALRIPPNAPALYNADGSLNWAPLANGTSTWLNPLAFLKETYTVQTNNLVGSALLSYQLMPGLDLKSSFGYTNLTTDEFLALPVSIYQPETRSSKSNIVDRLSSRINSWSIEPQLTYRRVIGKGTFDGLIGGTVQQNSTNLLQVVTAGYSNELLMHDITSATINLDKYSPSTKYKYNAVFSRLGYNLLDKYLVNLTARRDGSSRFGPGNQFHNFASIAGAWIFSAEELIKEHLPFLSFGKLRASYGTTGNDQIGDYQFLNEYSTVYAPVAYQGVAGLSPTGIPNPELAWEETRKLQGGFDLGFFKDRILLNVNYYRNRSSNQLLGYNLPTVAGFSAIAAANFPATVQNSGWEFALNTINIKTKSFTWSTNINFTSPKNKLIRFDNLETSSFSNTLFIGQPIAISRAFQYLGVDPTTGLYQVADKNGNATSTPIVGTDFTQILDRSPKIRGGVQNTFIYQDLQLDFLFQFSRQFSVSYLHNLNRVGYFVSSSDGFGGGNQPVAVLDRWQNPGEVKPFQRASTYLSPRGASGLQTYQALTFSTYSPLNSEDASYIRLKNVALSWNVPQVWAKTLHLNYAKLFLQGQNLLTFTKYSGLDPEAPNGVISLPSLRVVTFGVKIGI